MRTTHFGTRMDPPRSLISNPEMAAVRPMRVAVSPAFRHQLVTPWGTSGWRKSAGKWFSWPGLPHPPEFQGCGPEVRITLRENLLLGLSFLGLLNGIEMRVHATSHEI